MQESGGEILNCSTCTRPENHCAVCPVETGEQPEISERLNFYIKLYKRVQRYQNLPDIGGLLDQDERTMRMLDIIGEEVDAMENRKHKKRMAKTNSQNGKRY